MTQWTPKVETLVREAGELIDKQMKDFVNPKEGVIRTGLRAVFHGKTVNHALEKAFKEAGLESGGNWYADQQKLIDLAAQNNSNAADKIKAWSAINKDIVEQFKPSLPGIVKQIKFAKQKYGH